MEEEHDTKQNVIDQYIEFVKDNRRIPTVSDMKTHGVERHIIRYHFTNISRLHEHMSEHYSDDIGQFIINENALFSPKNLEKLQNDVGAYSRFFITTIISGKRIDTDYLAAIRTYCEKMNAKLLVLLCEDAASRRRESGWTIPSELADDTIVFNDVKLNDNVFIATIKLSAKQVNPLTGLSRIGQRNGTFVYASPKQYLEFVATSPKSDHMPHALMTTGALTVNDYSTDLYMSERTSYIAENDHTLGGVIVEVEDTKKFHFRQVQADQTGAFIDLGWRYNPDGTTEQMTTHLVLGDWHSGQTSNDVFAGVYDLMDKIPIQDLFMHDMFDGKSISHHDTNPGKLALKAMRSETSLEEEIETGAREIDWFHDQINGNVIMVKSNHDEFLDRYLENARYVFDAENHYIALDLARKMLEGVDVLRYAYENYGNVVEPDRIIWLARDDEYKVGGVEMAAHGDLGFNGSRASLAQMEKAYGNCIVGHSHSAAIYRNVFRVGTSTYLNLGYNRGPSSWTNTSCLIYPNGSRQLINFIDGDWRL